jgi:hypothetical protein
VDIWFSIRRRPRLIIVILYRYHFSCIFHRSRAQHRRGSYWQGLDYIYVKCIHSSNLPYNRGLNTNNVKHIMALCLHFEPLLHTMRNVIVYLLIKLLYKRPKKPLGLTTWPIDTIIASSSLQSSISASNPKPDIKKFPTFHPDITPYLDVFGGMMSQIEEGEEGRSLDMGAGMMSWKVGDRQQGLEALRRCNSLQGDSELGVPSLAKLASLVRTLAIASLVVPHTASRRCSSNAWPCRDRISQGAALKALTVAIDSRGNAGRQAMQVVTG